jgi:hypothetical protein
MYMCLPCLCTSFLVQGVRGTGYCGREGVFVMLACSKRGLVSLISFFFFTLNRKYRISRLITRYKLSDAANSQ